LHLDARNPSQTLAPPSSSSPSVRHHAAQLTTELGRPPHVAAVAAVVRSINYANKQLMGALLVAGWDAAKGGQIYGVPIGGALVPQQWATDGSGSTYIWGYLDAEWREGMTAAEAENLVTTALALAVSTDGSSGGMARLVTITKDGAVRRHVAGDQLPQFSESVEPGGEGIVVV
jgi:20S proteasome subunit beta 1